MIDSLFKRFGRNFSAFRLALVTPASVLHTLGICAFCGKFIVKWNYKTYKIKWYKTSMLSQQILPSRVLRQIEGGNEGRACIVIVAHFHIFNRARLDHRKVGFWILRKLPKCKLCLATVVIRVGLTLLMIPPKTTAVQILWTNVQKWWTNTNSCCEQTWFVCGAWPVGLFLEMHNLQQPFRNLKFTHITAGFVQFAAFP